MSCGLPGRPSQSWCPMGYLVDPGSPGESLRRGGTSHVAGRSWQCSSDTGPLLRLNSPISSFQESQEYILFANFVLKKRSYKNYLKESVTRWIGVLLTCMNRARPKYESQLVFTFSWGFSDFILK